MDSQTQAYMKYYSDQTGGQLPVFRGARRYQTGEGIGDILKGIFRTVFPIASHGLGTFLNTMNSGKTDTNTWKDAAMSAIAPTASAVIGKAVSARRGRQMGYGRKRGRKKRRTRKSKLNANRMFPSQLGFGRRKRAYKKRRERRRKTKSRRSKRINFLNF